MFASLFRADGADDRSPYGDFWFTPIGANSGAGVRVGPDQALRLSTVYRCVRVRAGTMASFRLGFYRQEGRSRKAVKDHPLFRLLAKKPNRWQNSFEWHEMMEGHVSLRGNGYNRIVANGVGEIEELVPLHPDRMAVELLDSGAFRYRYRRQNGEDEILAPGAVFKISGLSLNGCTGLNPMELGAESVGEGIAQQRYSSRFFANDARPLGGWIETAPGQKFATADAKSLFSESWQKANSGINRGKTAVLEGGMKYHEIGVNNKDAQMLEAKNAKVADICRWFGVPPHLAFALDRATDNNIERLSLEFIKFTMREEAERWEAAIEDQLLGADEGLEVEYDMDQLARGEMKSRAEFYQLGINGGWLTRNEAREMEGLNPLDELDEPLQPLNMVPAGTEPEPKPDAPAPQDDAPADDEADARARARTLELAIAGRVVRKEIVACRKAIAKPGQTAVSFREWLAGFYDEHIDYVVESLLCPTETAAAWCDRQQSELVTAMGRYQEPKALEALLDAWETSAAAELAARVHTCAQGAPPAPQAAPAPSVTVNQGDVHVQLPENLQMQVSQQVPGLEKAATELAGVTRAMHEQNKAVHQGLERVASLLARPRRLVLDKNGHPIGSEIDEER